MGVRMAEGAPYWMLWDELVVGGAAAAYSIFGHVRARVDTWLDPFADAEGYDRVGAPQEVDLANEALRLVALEAGERLVPEPALTGSDPLPLVPPADTGKSEERLADTGADPGSAGAAVPSIDPATVADRATYEDPQQPAAGIDMVLANGAVTYEKGAMTGNRPGRFLAA